MSDSEEVKSLRYDNAQLKDTVKRLSKPRRAIACELTGSGFVSFLGTEFTSYDYATHTEDYRSIRIYDGETVVAVINTKELKYVYFKDTKEKP